MIQDIVPGKYVVAVSGGIDSMVLLHMLAQRPDLTLVVAHFDHGVRADSAEDRKLVQAAAGQYGLPFFYKEGQLGPDVSEEKARRARYAFLRNVQTEQGADGLITAHHQDDVLETMLLNIWRGTHRRGLSSLQSTAKTARPLLHSTKNELRHYASRHAIMWREDSTNQQDLYTRNRLRQRYMPRLTDVQRQQLVAMNTRMRAINAEIDHLTEALLDKIRTENGFDRSLFALLPHSVSVEILAYYLRKTHQVELSKKLLERLVLAAKTARPGTQHNIQNTLIMKITRRSVVFAYRHRS